MTDDNSPDNQDPQPETNEESTSANEMWERVSQKADEIRAEINRTDRSASDDARSPEYEDGDPGEPVEADTNTSVDVNELVTEDADYNVLSTDEASARYAGGATGSGFIQLLVGKLLPTELEDRLERRLSVVVDAALLPNPASYYLRSLVGLGLGTAVVGMLAAVVGLALGRVPLPSVGPTVLWGGLVLVGAAGLGVVAGAVGYWYLVALVERREAEIERGYPDAMMFMYILSEGGMDQGDILHAIAESKTTFGEISREFEVIVQESEYLGTDYLTAMDRHADRTPSDLLEQFLTDFLSVTRSGGDMSDFLESKKDLAQRSARESQQVVLDKLQAAARMYVTVSIFPLLIVIMIIALSPVEQLPIAILYGVAYVMIPALSVLFFLWLWFSTPDTVGTGRMEDSWRAEMLSDTKYSTTMVASEHASNDIGGEYTPVSSLHPAGEGFTNTPALAALTNGSGVFQTLQRREYLRRVKTVFADPVAYFVERPLHTLIFTVPIAVGAVGYVFTSGQIEGGFQEAAIEWMLYGLYMPAMIVGLPFAIFYEIRTRISTGVYEGLPELLRQISSANDTGMVLINAIGSAVESTTTRVGEEFSTVYAKAKLGVPISTALVELNNKYESQVLARSIRLIEYAHRTTGDVTQTLEAAIGSLDTQIELANQRLSETRMQVAYVIVANLVLFGVFLMIDRMLLDLLFGGAGEFADGDVGEEADVLSDGYDPAIVAMILLHASVVHAISSGLIAGYIRRGDIQSGVKYVLGLLTIIVGGWWLI